MVNYNPVSAVVLCVVVPGSISTSSLLPDLSTVCNGSATLYSSVSTLGHPLEFLSTVCNGSATLYSSVSTLGYPLDIFTSMILLATIYLVKKFEIRLDPQWDVMRVASIQAEITFDYS